MGLGSGQTQVDAGIKKQPPWLALRANPQIAPVAGAQRPSKSAGPVEALALEIGPALAGAGGEGAAADSHGEGAADAGVERPSDGRGSDDESHALPGLSFGGDGAVDGAQSPSAAPSVRPAGGDGAGVLSQHLRDHGRDGDPGASPGGGPAAGGPLEACVPASVRPVGGAAAVTEEERKARRRRCGPRIPLRPSALCSRPCGWPRPPAGVKLRAAGITHPHAWCTAAPTRIRFARWHLSLFFTRARRV